MPAPPAGPIYAALGTVQFESLLARLPARGHDLPELPAYVRDRPWTGACTRCGATAEAVVLPRLRSKKRAKESGDPDVPRDRMGARLDQAAARPRARVDVRLLVPCRGATGLEWQPWMGRPYGGR